MGGSGSGWQGPKKTIVEDCLILSVKELTDFGAFKPGWRKGSYAWRCGEEQVAELEYSTSMSPDGTGTLWLRYTVEGQFMHYTVTIVTTVPHYGGRRWWFICPIKKIRVGKLYLPPGATQFGSRKAHDLTYTSCRESGSRQRSIGFFRRMARRLGVDYKGFGI
jgi:hypothetical protein